MRCDLRWPCKQQPLSAALDYHQDNPGEWRKRFHLSCVLLSVIIGGDGGMTQHTQRTTLCVWVSLSNCCEFLGPKSGLLLLLVFFFSLVYSTFRPTFCERCDPWEIQPFKKMLAVH